MRTKILIEGREEINKIVIEVLLPRVACFFVTEERCQLLASLYTRIMLLASCTCALIIFVILEETRALKLYCWASPSTRALQADVPVLGACFWASAQLVLPLGFLSLVLRRFTTEKKVEAVHMSFFFCSIFLLNLPQSLRIYKTEKSKQFYSFSFVNLKKFVDFENILLI